MERSHPVSEVLITALVLLFFGWTLPFFIENQWFGVIVFVREAVHLGDSGKLVVAAATYAVFTAIPMAALFTGLYLLSKNILKKYQLNVFAVYILLIVSYIILLGFQSQLIGFESELLINSLALTLTLLLLAIGKVNNFALVPVLLIGLQVFLGLQWLTVMPAFEGWGIGSTDIPLSIKTATSYLEGERILNVVGSAFLGPLMLSSILTAMLFRIQENNVRIVEENYHKAMAIENMQAKMMENRLYQEINSLAHDLKTPLVTIRGLASLITLSQDTSKMTTYSERIEGAAQKMNEMISSFLYSNAKATEDMDELLNYVRAQVPLEDDKLFIELYVLPHLPKVNINKVRISRALINLIENAIFAPNSQQDKKITITARKEDAYVVVDIVDNGMGIEGKHLDNIWQIGHSTKHSTGLGLPFAKQIIEEHEGKITLKSTVGVGTHVAVYLPAQESEDVDERD